jgi:predicted nucleic acid-binding protein
MDMLIAATAVAHGATVVTANIRDFPVPEVSLLQLPR